MKLNRKSHFICFLIICLLMGAGCTDMSRRSKSLDFKGNGYIIAEKDISVNTVWSGKMYIDSNVKVRNGAKLTIAPGTEIFFKKVDKKNDGVGDAGITIEAGSSIKAKGLYGKEILFTSIEENPRPGDWTGISINQGSPSEFYHCKFMFSDWVLHFHYTNIVVDHSQFINNNGGMRFRDGSVYISNNLIKSNKIGIRFWYSNPRMEGNQFENNETGIFFREACDRSIIFNNNFLKNNFHVHLGSAHKTDIFMSHNYWQSDDDNIEKHIYHKIDDESLGIVHYLPKRQNPLRMPWQEQ